jgi:hypothetical protein
MAVDVESTALYQDLRTMTRYDGITTYGWYQQVAFFLSLAFRLKGRTITIWRVRGGLKFLEASLYPKDRPVLPACGAAFRPSNDSDGTKRFGTSTILIHGV